MPRLAAQAGVRPIAVCFDDLDRSWLAVASAVEAAFPGLVRRGCLDPAQEMSEDDRRFVDVDGGVIIDKARFLAAGIFIGQDALHVYFRLVESLEWRSWDAAWSMRVARKLLQAWSRAGRDHVRAEHVEDPVDSSPWLQLGLCVARDAEEVLTCYFHGRPLPQNAFALLEAQRANTWRHPDTSAILPTCAKQ